MKIHELDELIKEKCPIDGINSNGVIWYKDNATEDQKTLALDLMKEYLPLIE